MIITLLVKLERFTAAILDKKSNYPIYINLGFPQPIYQINQGVNGHTTRAPPGVPHTRASLEPGTSGFATRRINHYATIIAVPLITALVQVYFYLSLHVLSQSLAMVVWLGNAAFDKVTTIRVNANRLLSEAGNTALLSTLTLRFSIPQHVILCLRPCIPFNMEEVQVFFHPPHSQ